MQIRVVIVVKSLNQNLIKRFVWVVRKKRAVVDVKKEEYSKAKKTTRDYISPKVGKISLFADNKVCSGGELRS